MRQAKMRDLSLRELCEFPILLFLNWGHDLLCTYQIIYSISHMMKAVISRGKIRLFQRTIWEYYKREGRDLPWRKTTDPYQILVSEIMLQQTQVERVIGKYEQFLSAFPDFPSLAQAPLKKVLSAWQGLGYNRRA